MEPPPGRPPGPPPLPPQSQASTHTPPGDPPSSKPQFSVSASTTIPFTAKDILNPTPATFKSLGDAIRGFAIASSSTGTAAAGDRPRVSSLTGPTARAGIVRSMIAARAAGAAQAAGMHVIGIGSMVRERRVQKENIGGRNGILLKDGGGDVATDTNVAATTPGKKSKKKKKKKSKAKGILVSGENLNEAMISDRGRPGFDDVGERGGGERDGVSVADTVASTNRTPYVNSNDVPEPVQLELIKDPEFTPFPHAPPDKDSPSYPFHHPLDTTLPDFHIDLSPETKQAVYTKLRDLLFSIILDFHQKHINISTDDDVEMPISLGTWLFSFETFTCTGEVEEGSGARELVKLCIFKGFIQEEDVESAIQLFEEIMPIPHFAALGINSRGSMEIRRFLEVLEGAEKIAGFLGGTHSQRRKLKQVRTAVLKALEEQKIAQKTCHEVVKTETAVLVEQYRVYYEKFHDVVMKARETKEKEQVEVEQTLTAGVREIESMEWIDPLAEKTPIVTGRKLSESDSFVTAKTEASS